MPAYMRTPLTDEQREDMQHCLYEWLSIRQANGRPPTVTAADVVKSCLLGRMTLEGKPPLPEPPPTAYSAPWYDLIEEGSALLSGFELHGPHTVMGACDSRYMLVCQHPWAIVEDCTDGWLVRCAEVQDLWTLHRVAGRPDRWELIRGARPQLGNAGAQTPTSSSDLSPEALEG